MSMQFYNFVNGEYDYSKNELWLPVGLGRKVRHLPKKSNANLSQEELDKYVPFNWYNIAEHDLLAMTIYDDDPWGIVVNFPESSHDIRTSNLWVYGEATIYSNILSIKVPPQLSAPFAKIPSRFSGVKSGDTIAEKEYKRFNNKIRRWEVWLDGPSGDVLYLPIWNGRFAKEDPSWYEELLLYPGAEWNFLSILGDTYGQTL